MYGKYESVSKIDMVSKIYKVSQYLGLLQYKEKIYQCLRLHGLTFVQLAFLEGSFPIVLCLCICGFHMW